MYLWNGLQYLADLAHFTIPAIERRGNHSATQRAFHPALAALVFPRHGAGLLDPGTHQSPESRGSRLLGAARLRHPTDLRHLLSTHRRSTRGRTHARPESHGMVLISRRGFVTLRLRCARCRLGTHLVHRRAIDLRLLRRPHMGTPRHHQPHPSRRKPARLPTRPHGRHLRLDGRRLPHQLRTECRFQPGLRLRLGRCPRSRRLPRPDDPPHPSTRLWKILESRAGPGRILPFQKPRPRRPLHRHRLVFHPPCRLLHVFPGALGNARRQNTHRHHDHRPMGRSRRHDLARLPHGKMPIENPPHVGSRPLRPCASP